MKIKINNLILEGELTVPKNSKGIVIFAHNSGSNRFSPRNQYVADILNKNFFATLLINLLTLKEEAKDACTREFRFNIELSADRLSGLTEWVLNQPDLQDYKIGYFGASTGAGAALIAETKKFKQISAIVSRGGRPDLAVEYLPLVQAPTLLLVGEKDPLVIDLNKEALAKLNVQADLVIIPNASHFFEEKGTLKEVANYTLSWFEKFLTKDAHPNA